MRSILTCHTFYHNSIRAVRNVYLNNNVYICSESQSPLPFLSHDVPHPYHPREKHETEVVSVTRRFYQRTDVIMVLQLNFYFENSSWRITWSQASYTSEEYSDGHTWSHASIPGRRLSSVSLICKLLWA